MQIILNAMITQCSVIINQTIHLIYYIPCILQLHLQLWSPQMLLWKHFCHMRRITKWAQPCFNIGSSSQIVCEPKLATAFFTLSAEKCNICTKNLYRLGCVILHVPWWLIAFSEHSVKQFWVYVAPLDVCGSSAVHGAGPGQVPADGAAFVRHRVLHLWEHGALELPLEVVAHENVQHRVEEAVRCRHRSAYLESLG